MTIAANELRCAAAAAAPSATDIELVDNCRFWACVLRRTSPPRAGLFTIDKAAPDHALRVAADIAGRSFEHGSRSAQQQ